MKPCIKIIVLILLFPNAPGYAQKQTGTWHEEFMKELKLMGHRNWILIVDAAYPLQGKPAIKTICTGEDQLTVVREVINSIDEAPHVFPEVFLDREIDFISESDARGIDEYKKSLWDIFSNKTVIKSMHEDMIKKVDEAAKTFNILVLKTNMTIPYTSVFLRLNCGYWTPGQESKLRQKMGD